MSGEKLPFRFLESYYEYLITPFVSLAMDSLNDRTSTIALKMAACSFEMLQAAHMLSN